MINEDVGRVSVNLADVTGFVQIERELLKRNRDLLVINAISSAFIAANDTELIYSNLLDRVLLATEFSLGWFVIKDSNGFVLKCASGGSIEFRNKLKEGKLDDFYNKILSEDSPLYVLESREMPDDLKKEGIFFFSGIPLLFGNETIGFVFLASRSDVVFDFDIASLLSLIGNTLSLVAGKMILFKETERLAITDSLTGLSNVRYFYSALDAEIARCQRYNSVFSLILFDIDNFKGFNDKHGHQAGDEVLRALSVVMKNEARKSDIVARYGGEEFIVILPNTTKIEAYHLATRIKDAIEATKFLDNNELAVSLSGGVATFPEDAGNAKNLLYAADMSMYQAKAEGKRRICCYRKKQ